MRLISPAQEWLVIHTYHATLLHRSTYAVANHTLVQAPMTAAGQEPQRREHFDIVRRPGCVRARIAAGPGDLWTSGPLHSALCTLHSALCTLRTLCVCTSRDGGRLARPPVPPSLRRRQCSRQPSRMAELSARARGEAASPLPLAR